MLEPILRKSDFSAVVNSGLKKRHNNITFYIKKTETPKETTRIGFIIPKKVEPLATRRNYIKRVMRESFRKNQHLIAREHDLWIVMKKSFSRGNRTKVVRLFLNALIEIHYR